MNKTGWKLLFVALALLGLSMPSKAAMTKLSVAYSNFYDDPVLHQLDWRVLSAVIGSGYCSRQARQDRKVRKSIFSLRYLPGILRISIRG
jgi:hypothetical protein